MSDTQLTSSASPRRVVLETSEPEATRSFMDEVYGVSLRVDSVSGPARMEHVGAGTVSMDVHEFSVDLHAKTDPFPGLVVVAVNGGLVEWSRQGITDRAAAGEVLVAAGPGDGMVGASLSRGPGDPFREQSTTLPWSLVHDAVCDIRGREWTGDLQFEQLTPATDAARQHWRQMLEYLWSDVLARDETLLAPLVMGSVGRMLAHAAVIAFPNSATREEDARKGAHDRHDASPATVRRAVAFIESSAATDITVADIAAAAHVTPRALQYAFRRHLETTPMGYVRRVRLDLARRDLLAGDEATTISGVAARWGFFNPGRFASAYRSAHGENPRVTLRRRAG